LLMLDSPTIAQSNPTREHARISFTSVHQYVAAEAIPTQLALPANLIVSPMYRPLVEAMLRDSPTFRRQCVRIAGEPSLTVRLAIAQSPPTHGTRATTQIRRNDEGQLTAVVDLSSSRDTQELIAHEFEHIVELLDGVDLAALAASRHSGVTTIGRGENMFETTRAQRAGLKVAAEQGR
jgi:hypothetical protein